MTTVELDNLEDLIKKCTKCGVIKNLSEFHNDKNRKGGKACWCKECNCAHVREYTARNNAKKPKPIYFSGIKLCTKCMEWKDNNKFGVNKNKGGTLNSWCKLCMAKDARTRRANDTRPKVVYLPKMDGVKKCSKCKLEKDILEFSKNSVRKDGRSDWCVECSRKSSNSYASRHRDKYADKSREWHKNNLDYIRVRNRKKYHNNIQYKLSIVLRNCVNSLLSGKCKGGSAVRDLGCSTSELKLHLESMFYSHSETGEMMTWENWGFGYGKWNIDNIKPLASFNLEDREQFLVVCNYKNLQPLWFEENMRKGAKYVH